jgi:hypothetical protein
LARNYESNGPEVKIRGTAAHIAEKYMSLARDALAAGDMIAAESYFQHAEHYNRIIMAAQSQLGPQHGSHPGEGGNGGFRPRWNADASDEDGPDMEGGPSMGGGEDMRGGGGRDRYGRRGPNGSEAGGRDSDGSDPADAPQSDESASDPVG